MISSDDNGKVDGVSFKDEDILAYNAANNRWALVFDGSDVGFGKVDLEAFDVLADGSILLVPSKKITIPGLGEVTPSDIVRFIPTSLGANTVGAFEWYFDGSDVGLSGSSEYIDAIAFDTTGRLLISTEGSFNAGGVKGNDEDLFAFSKTTLGATTAGTWALYFDGSRVALTNGDEDVNGAWVKSNGDLYLGTKGKFVGVSSVNMVGGDKNDLFTCKLLATGAATDCTFAAVFDGDNAHFKYDIADLAIVATSQLKPFTAVIAAADEVEGEQYAVEIDTEQSDLAVDAELTEADLDLEETLVNRSFLPFVVK